ncbi:MAG TPA: hypothetical protein VD969_06070 [Symbiobacteriaceae bacterium]|nr:hypothetical protein [Symbiobacteriaceae bacterium]
MAYEPILVTVDGKPVRLVRGAEVKHALIRAGLLSQVRSGKFIVWDETAGAPTDPGGALYNGQRLSVRPKKP